MAGKAGNAVKRKERNTPPVPPKCTGDVEARIIALACSEPPGREIEMDAEASFRKVRGAEDNRLHIPYAGGKDTKIIAGVSPALEGDPGLPTSP